MRSIRLLFFTLILAAGIAGCAGGDPEAAAVEAYLEGIVAQDDVMVTNFSCSDWEFDAGNGFVPRCESAVKGFKLFCS